MNTTQAIDQFISSFSRPAPRLFFGLLKPFLTRTTQQTGNLIPSLEDLAQLPHETLGYTFTRFLEAHHLQPIRFGPRRAQVHDVVHLLTGYGTDPMGELEVQAFLVGSSFQPFNLLLSIPLVLRLSAWTHAWMAFERGRKSHFDPDTFPVEALWTVPLTQVRQRYGISKPVYSP
ncbi:Coq4 family protein [Anthocerotibacter panamensis]|uniref:Coq4 family protein n=1 Tax=Anthocerotibacter panamensis TaxID=2857077 RepID=UPI001C4018F5|nr:Coq4 family protein [Anthocerotibacter panamensis]